MKTPLTIPNFLTPPSTEVSHFVAQDTQLVICDGVNPCYKQGELRKDTGYTNINTAIHAKSINGLFYFEQSAATKKLLATIDDATSANTELWYSTGGNFAQITTTAWNTYHGQSVEMESYLGYCFFVGSDGTNFLPVASLAGTSFSTSTNVTSMPQAKYIIRYRDRIYVANSYYSGTAYPYRVYYCDEPVAGAITWTPATGFIDVDYSDYITGMGSNWDRLMVFTTHAAYMYDQTSWKNVFDVGCISHRTIKNVEGYMVWVNYENVYASSSGGRPQAIGNDILELIRNATLTSAKAEVCDNEYHLYLGTTSANGITYTNCLATYNFDKGMWRWRELHHVPTSMAVADLSTYQRLYFGSTDGKVYVKGRYADGYVNDGGYAISSWFRTRAFDFGSPEVLKRITKVFVYARDAGNLQMRIRAFDKESETVMPWTDVGNLDEGITTFFPSLEGHFIQFEFKEMGKTQPWIFNAMTLLGMQTSHEVGTTKTKMQTLSSDSGYPNVLSS